MKKVFLILSSLLLLYGYSYSKDWNDTPFPGPVTTPNGEYGYSEIIDLPAESATVLLNDVSIATATLVDSGTTYVDGTSGTGKAGGMGFTQITYPRNISIDTVFADGESTTTVTGTLTVYGFDNKGVYTNETISVSTNSADGNIAWLWIDTMTLSGMAISGACGSGGIEGVAVSTCSIKIGVSDKIGVWGDLRAKDDVYKITAGYVDISTRAYTSTDATYDTIDMSTTGLGQIPSGSLDYRIWYKKNVNH